MSADISKLSQYAIVSGSAVQQIAKLSEFGVVSGRRVQYVSKLSQYVITNANFITLLDLKWNINVDFFTTTLDLQWHLNYVPPAPIASSESFVWQLNALYSTTDFVWAIAEASTGFTFNFPFTWDIAEAYASPDAIVIPDWPITETWEFMTGIFRSKNGAEQRRSYIPRPIVRLQYEALALEDQDMRQIRKIAEVDIGSVYPVPLTQYFDFLQEQAGPSDTRLYFDPQRTNAIAGQFMAFIHAETSETIVRLVTAVYADGVDVIAPIGATAGYHYACPIRYCRINTSAGGTGYNSYMQTTYNYVSADRTAKFNRSENDIELREVAGTIVLDKIILADEGMREDYLEGVSVLDNLRAEPIIFLNEATRRKQGLAFLIQREIEPWIMDYWRKFAEAVRGQSVAFALPSYRPDAAPAVVPALGASVVTVFGTDAYNVFSQGGYFGLMIDTANGREYRKVASVSIVGSNTAMTLDAPLGSIVGDNSFDAISFMYLVRLASDTMTLTHNETVSVLNFEVQMVRA